MPRRRMLDPSFTDDIYVAKLTRDERLFLIGCVRNSDDDGRLRAHPAYLKAEIFMYDDDIDLERMRELKQSTIEKMKSWPKDNMWLMVAYENSGEDYLYFPNWPIQQKPSHPTPSKLPIPPTPETPPKATGEKQELLPKISRASPSQSRSGQSSLGQVRLGQVRAVQEDFTKFLDSEKDLTDFLMTRLKEYMPAAPQQAMSVVKQMWRQVTNVEMDSSSFQAIFPKLKTCPLQTFAASVVKSAKYSIGKKKPANYILAVFDDQMKGETRERSP